MSEHHQENHYERDYDYQSESPHLQHRHLNEMLMRRVADLVVDPTGENDHPTVLEIGAGDGAVSESLLNLGCDVTGTEMSRHSVDAMTARFGSSDRFRAEYDEDGSLEVLGDRRFDAILYASVLHHIPDYLTSIANAIDRHLEPGGSLISVQDPLWYPRMDQKSLRLTKLAYLSWRVTQGDLGRGLKTRFRRIFKGISEDVPADTVEYHMVRSGVDEEAISRLLTPRFEEVEVLSYWSSQGARQQRFGEKRGMVNTFAVFAGNYRPADGQAAGD